jgi:hypothetical protein
VKTAVELMPRRWDQASAAAGWLEGRSDGLREQARRVHEAFDSLQEMRRAELDQMVDAESRQYMITVLDVLSNVRYFIETSCIE